MKPVAKFFNTAGPIQPSLHYNIDPLIRINVEEIELLIHQQKYFVLHAPRQTGKTSCLLALRDYLNGGIAAPGQEIPDINSKGTDVNTKISIHVSRLRMAMDVVMAKKIQAAK